MEEIQDNSEYIRILKYLNFQKIRVNNDLLVEIHKVDNNQDSETLDISIEQYNNIKKGISILKNIEKDYLYYILIIESLPNNIIINLFRYFSYNYIRQHNQLENEPPKNNDTINYYPLKYKMKDIISSPNPKLILIDTINDLNNKDTEITKYFIKCLNNFFL